jgi:predicted acetyltransferase
MFPPASTKLSSLELEPATEERVSQLFRRFTEDRMGFVLRPKNFLELRLLEPHPHIKRDLCLQTEDGYVLANENQGGVEVQELVALRPEAQHALLEVLEGQGSSVVDKTITSDALLSVYEERGYRFAQGSYSVLMAKFLMADASVERLYGDSFFASSLILL